MWYNETNEMRGRIETKMFLEKPPIISDLMFTHVVLKKGPMCQVQARPFSSLSFRKSGSITVSSQHGVFTSGPNTLTFIPKGCTYESEILEDGEMYFMHFYTVGDMLEVPKCAVHNFPTAVSNLFGNATLKYASSGADLSCISMAYELLAEAQLAFSPVVNHPHKRMKTCKQYIDENICNSELRISALAEMCDVSEVYFRREFKRIYGVSPLDYIKKRRIEIAKGLLQTGLCSITETAFQSGFESVSYFSYEFRRMTGMSPSEYMNQEAFRY